MPRQETHLQYLTVEELIQRYEALKRRFQYLMNEMNCHMVLLWFFSITRAAQVSLLHFSVFTWLKNTRFPALQLLKIAWQQQIQDHNNFMRSIRRADALRGVAIDAADDEFERLRLSLNVI